LSVSVALFTRYLVLVTASEVLFLVARVCNFVHNNAMFVCHTKTIKPIIINADVEWLNERRPLASMPASQKQLFLQTNRKFLTPHITLTLLIVV